VTLNDLWLTTIIRGESETCSMEDFILDVSRVPGGKLDEAHASVEALSIACDSAVSMNYREKIVASVHHINEAGTRDHACSATALWNGHHYIDADGSYVQPPLDGVQMNRIGNLL